MNYRNISLEIDRLKKGLELYRRLRKELSKRRTDEERERHDFTVQVIGELNGNLKEALEFQEAM